MDIKQQGGGVNTPWTVIQKLGSDNSRLFKESVILGEIGTENHVFFAGAKLALDKLVTFGVKQVPEAKADGPGLPWSEFVTELATPLQNRFITGHDARDKIIELMNKATIEQWNDWYRLILIKDLKCGVSEKTINNVAKKAKTPLYMIPTFTCQLAHDSE